MGKSRHTTLPAPPTLTASVREVSANTAPPTGLHSLPGSLWHCWADSPDAAGTPCLTKPQIANTSPLIKECLVTSQLQDENLNEEAEEGEGRINRGSSIDIYALPCVKMGFPGGSDDKESSCNGGDPGLIPGLGSSPWRREWQPTPGFLPGESRGQRSLAGYGSRSCRAGHDWVTNTHTSVK